MKSDRTWTLKSAKTESYLYDVVDGLARVCRFKSKAAAERMRSRLACGDHFRPRRTQRSKVRREERTLNHWRKRRRK